MFRKLTRAKQALNEEECYALLRREKRGILAVNGEDGYPYALPMNHFYDDESGKIYFHSGKIGYKTDCLAKNEKACFTVTERGEKKEGEWWLTVRSVVLFGKVEISEDPALIRSISEKLSRKFTQDEAYIEKEIEKYAAATLLLVFTIEDMCGKVVREK